MHHTPWTKKASTLPSDRIRPSAPPATPKNSKGKGKGASPAPPEPPKSKAVKTLESLRDALAASADKATPDPKGGCFCQARAHPLSSYSALCRSCGLVLCAINLPQYACPHCTTPLLAPAQRTTLVERLETQIAETLAREAAARERAAEEARRAVGAFPTLGGAVPPQQTQPQQPQTRTVLSLNSKTKKVTVSAFTRTPTPASSSPASRAESPAEDEPLRVRAPPAAVPCAAAAAMDVKRPWRDLLGTGVVYVPTPSLDNDDDAKVKKRRRHRGKGKAGEKENEEGEAVGDAEGSTAPSSSATIIG